MDESLPDFRYFPDPVGAGSLRADADTPCLSCNRIRGYIYTGPVSTEKNFLLEDHICPWCIADGSAAKQFGATFNYTGTADGIPDSARVEIETRTPGFTAWQQEQWLSCCNDGAAFLGLAGAKELREKFADALPSVKQVIRDDYGLSGADLKEFLDALTVDDQPTAYIFRCLHCKKYLSYVDET